MIWGGLLVFLTSSSLALCQNTTDLEVRVIILEEDVSDLEVLTQDLVTDNNLQDQRLNTMEQVVADNENDIEELTVDVVALKQTIAVLEGTVTLLQYKVYDMETHDQRISDLELFSNVTTSDLSGLESVVNATIDSVEKLESDLQAGTVRLTAVEEYVEDLTEKTAAIEINDADQDDRVSVVENEVDLWDDRIQYLESVNIETQSRIDDLEDIIMVPWTACTSSPCQNGGSCIDVNIDTFICMCRDSFFGSNCENSYAEASFMATVDTNLGDPPNPIPFNVEVLNPGGHYNATSGIYTVPLDGVYEFNAHVWTLEDSGFNIYLYINGTLVMQTYALEGTYDDPYADMSGIFSLPAGQEVWVSDSGLIGMQGSTSYAVSWFSGHLLYPL